MGWAGRFTYNVLITCALGTVVCTISNSTTCQQCNPGDGESPACCTYVPLLAARVRVFGSHLDRFVARDELYKTYMVHSHAVDGRRLQVVGGASVRKAEAFSQNRPRAQGAAPRRARSLPRAAAPLTHMASHELLQAEARLRNLIGDGATFTVKSSYYSGEGFLLSSRSDASSASVPK